MGDAYFAVPLAKTPRNIWDSSGKEISTNFCTYVLSLKYKNIYKINENTNFSLKKTLHQIKFT